MLDKLDCFLRFNWAILGKVTFLLQMKHLLFLLSGKSMEEDCLFLKNLNFLGRCLLDGNGNRISGNETFSLVHSHTYFDLCI